MVLGRLTLERAVQPSNAPSSIVFVPWGTVMLLSEVHL